ncbi:hypothetical protein LTR91_009405 [Friedmanniomyces endolithicus]|uniref:LysM domain-containing protein n=1 Tax=Friedmanniomyces endolithicus TaxID=329885 RepID=A0AAN6QTW5_9PEZI|nr:hypothetical protein LTR01_004803 [Friedmanniomyces endolithicus]KAK0325759.1 hypothetical protein LTR82_003296 [Friedmanniomyces endolithicus]KAK0829936.1 hypothetical protein LTR73_004073 [Friedmanniomyces endolithicus]KAK0926891.1 hypothetical protein LTR57_003934 [Friedmanniomyces endolithicus]KAK0984416.1 hypothetical protein LTS01_010634 [Friedmanniomyces endolithicus]
MHSSINVSVTAAKHHFTEDHSEDSNTHHIRHLKRHDRRLISGLDEGDEGNLDSTGTVASRIASPLLSPLNSRAASPIPSARLSRPESSRRVQGSGGHDRLGGRAAGGGQREAGNGSSSSLSGLWGSSWTALQGIASDLLTGDAAFDASDKSKRSRRPLRGRSGPRSSTSAPPGQWGPGVGPTSHPGPASIGSGSRDKQLAALRAQKRKDMLMTQDASYADTLGKFKRRLSDEGASLSAPPSENEDRDALVYVHHVQKADTLAGITIKYNCSVATLHKANRMWPNDPVHSRDTLILPVDACGVKGKMMPGSEALDLLSSDADALSAGQAEEVPTPDPQLLNGDAFSRNRTNSSSTNTSRRPSTAALSNGVSGPPWHHDSWVLLPADTKPTEIARLSRRALGYFPPTRRKSNCYSDLDTPSASFDLTRPATNDQQLLAASPSRQDLRPPRPRRLSNANNGYFPAYMAGPGGVGTMNRNVHFPGPAQDGLNKFFAKHLPNVAPPRNHQALLTPEMPLYSDELTPVASGTTSPNLMATNVNLENVGGAIETWMRRMATQAKGAMQNPDRQKAARASVGTPGKGAGGIGDLIEMTDEFEIGDDDDVNESHDDEEHGRGRRESVLHVGTEPTSSAVSYYEDTGIRERSKGGKKGKDD